MFWLKKIFFIIIVFLSLVNCISCVSNNSYSAVDSYGWMETEKDLTNNWLLSESNRSMKILEKLDLFSSIEKRFSELTDYGTEPIIHNIRLKGDNTFYLKRTNKHPYNRLFVKDRFGKERLLVDPPVGYIYNLYPSNDGKYVAYAISENDSEISSIKVINVKTRAHLADSLSGITFSNLVWANDNLSFFYHRNNFADSGNRKSGTEELYLHRLGSNSDKDLAIFGKANIENYQANIDQYTYLSLSANWAVVSVESSISGDTIDLYLTDSNSLNLENKHWKKIIDRKQKVTNFLLRDNWLYLAKYNNFSGYTLSRLDLNHIHYQEEKIIEWKKGELTRFTVSKDAIYLAYYDSGKYKFVTIPFADLHNIKSIPVSDGNEVTAIFSSSDHKEILFTQQNWNIPPKIWQYDPDSQLIEDSKIIKTDASLFADYESEQKWVKSNDGELIPLTLIHRKGIKLDGNNPTWLTAYGAYGENSYPNYYDTTRLIWLEKGGIIAIAHIRGGGELGPKWHHDGKGKNKINSVNDFIKCAKYLIDHRYTNSSKLVISGASAGGIVIGSALARHPELFAAASITSGMLNMSRLDQIPIGSVNFAEFGSPFNKQEFKNLQTIDAYLNLREGVNYPPVMLSVGLQDARVSPWQSAKFAARLGEINSSQNENVFIIANQEDGHFINYFIDMMVFFMWKTNISD
ncbi:prolyl oligopeptidase family serine peptidase [Gilliamella apis]|uniref:prolyl oligopeptidase family serine peptidase n=1 Tax=Gilliamella apis TaxID=1970738 RepID=UPI000D783721|nr:prolyl oligopeptidase family serine peptidase [Gilliamella apis]PXY90727.1 hypothetical protein DKK77_10535 [Gilliamella apis]WLS96600.1 prolyl oligopeptidase family serine peptidase [Gilliamella apis]